MKIIFVANQYPFFRHMLPIAEPLVQKGHHVALWFCNVEKANVSSHSVEVFIEQHAAQSSFLKPTKKSRRLTDFFARFFRDVLGYHTYLIPGYTSVEKKKAFLERIHSFSRLVLRLPGIDRLLRAEKNRTFLRKLYDYVPVNPQIRRELQHAKPDVLVIVSNLRADQHAQELEYARAGVVMGIPTVNLVASWDNLSTKGTFSVFPDAILVWNQPMFEEAVLLHQAPPHKVLVTGAETFDYLFNAKPSRSRAAFHQQLHIGEEEKYVLYLGSSSSMTGDETSFVREFVKALWTRLRIRTLVRPHPLNAAIWSNFDEPGCVIWPKGGELPDEAQAQQNFIDTLVYSVAVVGINTSAMLESAIADKPCVTIRAPIYRASQTAEGHFRHLLNGGFLEVAESHEEAVDIIEQVLNGQDRLAPARKKFVETFIRPHGLNVSCGPLISSIVEWLAEGRSAQEIQNLMLAQKTA